MLLWKDRHLRLALTSLGIQYLVALLAVGAFAANTGNNLLYLIFALMLGLFLVSGVVSRKALQGLRFQSLEEGNLFARVRGGLRVRLADAAPDTPRGLELHLELEGGTVEPSFLAGAQGEAEPVVVLHARAERRGWTRLTALELRTRHPFGFLEKAWRLELDRPVLVLPHPRTPGELATSEPEEGRGSLPQAGQSSPEGVRPLRQGDPPARVHWKRTAQRSLPGALHPWVRTFEEERPKGLHLELDLRDWAPGRPFERELERLSGAVLQARLQRREVRLEVRGAEGTRLHREPTACWRALAVAQAAGRANPA
ncbi:MAG TPA: DUF58 domain-containing protein [Holophagaceae bacterium]|nr:DUF58 domain-containing protein [Holophagaceae bacterium]